MEPKKVSFIILIQWIVSNGKDMVPFFILFWKDCFLIDKSACFSTVVGPRHPLQKEPNLDYDVDSDEEWEEVHILFLLWNPLFWVFILKSLISVSAGRSWWKSFWYWQGWRGGNFGWRKHDEWWWWSRRWLLCSWRLFIRKWGTAFINIFMYSFLYISYFWISSNPV